MGIKKLYGTNRGWVMSRPKLRVTAELKLQVMAIQTRKTRIQVKRNINV